MNDYDVELVYDPSIAEEYKREQAQKEANARAAEGVNRLTAQREAMEIREEEDERPEIWRTTAVSTKQLGEFYYDHKYRAIDWRSPEGEEVSLIPEDWKKLAEAIPRILHVLGAE